MILHGIERAIWLWSCRDPGCSVVPRQIAGVLATVADEAHTHHLETGHDVVVVGGEE